MFRGYKIMIDLRFWTVGGNFCFISWWGNVGEHCRQTVRSKYWYRSLCESLLIEAGPWEYSLIPLLFSCCLFLLHNHNILERGDVKILRGNYHVVLLVERDKTRQKGRSRKKGLNGFLLAGLQPSTSEQLKINFHSKVII